MSTDQDTTRRVAVITGASSGIGEATARALAADGHRVALLARRAGRIEALADELGAGAIAIEADVTDRDSVVAGAERVKDELGGADILVNNAGVMLLGPFVSEQREEHRRMVETNLLGAMTATEVFLDQLRDGGGDLVNLSSVAGRFARPGNAAYAATKWGMNGWSEALRQELQPGVRVMLIEPGAVATELTDHITDAGSRQAAERMYEQMAITAQDIAEVIAFAVERPRRMTLNEILIRPTGSSSELRHERPEHVRGRTTAVSVLGDPPTTRTAAACSARRGRPNGRGGRRCHVPRLPQAARGVLSSRHSASSGAIPGTSSRTTARPASRSCRIRSRPVGSTARRFNSRVRPRCPATCACSPWSSWSMKT
jgi:NADP-dependent 3-hydroxy acid dehydrogenase YdfG